ncbi:hypothetical protein SeLEV6574_g04302 [Synchytrium endobioticum]|uniref:Uncharacterized protein n=1 Tax=Synchytrium endobioticum TaxID=286115 RepID=A0A507D023_9FUNG|nr:hypothetical protein SeLEV6574_g04302 [Synchytrium endobioticum]
MSEECLFDLLFDIPSFQKTVREVARVDAKATRAAFMKNPSKGRLLDEVFLLPPEMLAKSRCVLDDSPRRYVRTPSFKTNGLVLCLLWIDTSSKPSPPDRKVEDAINLPNIFSNKSLQSTHKDAWIIALDPGATCIVGAVAYDPNHPDQRRNLAVTTKCLAEPERHYRDWLEADKPEAICTAERECTKSDQETWAVFLRRFVTSNDITRAYYSTKRYKRKRWDADKAKRGELDRVLEGIVNMVDESMGHKRSGGKQVIVGIGMGDFSSNKSRHVMYTRGYLEHDERPTYLKPPSKDKNTPMKRKADEGGTSRGAMAASYGLPIGIAYVMGRSLQYMVRSFVNDILIPPLLAFLFPGADRLRDRFLIVRRGKSGANTYKNLQAAIKDGAITINYGRFSQETVSFFTVAFALYQLLRVLSAFFKWNLSFDDRDCPYCLCNIPGKATRCRHCAADLTDVLRAVSPRGERGGAR